MELLPCTLHVSTSYILHFYRVEIKNLIRGFDVVDNDEGDDDVMVCLQEDSINSILEK